MRLVASRGPVHARGVARGGGQLLEERYGVLRWVGHGYACVWVLADGCMAAVAGKGVDAAAPRILLGRRGPTCVAGRVLLQHTHRPAGLLHRRFISVFMVVGQGA